MTFNIIYHPLVLTEDLPELNKTVKSRIRLAIQDKLLNDPLTFGKPLRKSMKGYRRLRVGDYRVIFRIEGKFVKVLLIKHRSVVYQKSGSRLA